MARIDIEIGRTLDDVGVDFVAAWRKAEAGEAVEASAEGIVFRDWAALCSVLTPKRYEMLRKLHETPASGVRALARALGRDPRPVHADVVALEAIGLVVRSESGSISAPMAAITSIIHLAA